MRSLFLILFLSLAFFSCKKNKSGSPAKVEIYLLKSYEQVSGQCKINPQTAVLNDAPLVSDKDIVQYSKSDYEYVLTDLGIQKIKAVTPRTPFAFTVDRQVIFYGMTMLYTMSSTCDNSITMLPDMGGANKVQLKLGYPGIYSTDPTIDDQRNNAKLIAALAYQGKLK